jgi:uncharacterized membrane protein HdeD (DUF308 family)
MTAASVSRSEAPMVPWWLVLLEGIALAILGLLLVLKPAMSSIILIQFMGIYWFVGGIFKIVSIFIDRSIWGWKLLAGILGIMAGIIVINHPLWSPLVVYATLVIILGIEGIIYGAIGILQAFQGAGWGAGLLGAVSVVFGIILLVNYGAAAVWMPWTLGILGLVGGIAAIVMAFRLK